VGFCFEKNLAIIEGLLCSAIAAFCKLAVRMDTCLGVQPPCLLCETSELVISMPCAETVSYFIQHGCRQHVSTPRATSVNTTMLVVDHQQISKQIQTLADTVLQHTRHS
jgi:hypothetical protein